MHFTYVDRYEYFHGPFGVLLHILPFPLEQQLECTFNIAANKKTSANFRQTKTSLTMPIVSNVLLISVSTSITSTEEVRDNL